MYQIIYLIGNTMEWTQFIIMFLGMIGLFAWNRAEARSDSRNADAMIKAIHEEIKDFHGRLERQDAEFKAHLMYNHDKK